MYLETPETLILNIKNQFLKRPVWRKISIWKINLNIIIQKSKLRRNRQDET